MDVFSITTHRLWLSLKLFKRDPKIRWLPLLGTIFALLWLFEYWSAELQAETKEPLKKFSLMDDGMLRIKIGLYLALIISLNYRAGQGEYFAEKKKKMHPFLKSFGFGQVHTLITYVVFNFVLDLLLTTMLFYVVFTKASEPASLAPIVCINVLATLVNAMLNSVFSQFFSDENVAVTLLNLVLLVCNSAVAYTVKERTFAAVTYFHPLALLMDFVLSRCFIKDSQVTLPTTVAILCVQAGVYFGSLIVINSLRKGGAWRQKAAIQAPKVDRLNLSGQSPRTYNSLEEGLNADSSGPLLQVKEVRKRFGSNSVLEGVNFSVDKGEIVCLLGANGAGKSTLFNVVLGEEPQDSGEVLKAWGEKPIAFCPQTDMGWDFATVREHLGFVKTVQQHSGAWSAAHEEYFEKVRDICELESHLDTYFNALSGGFKRRLTISMTLLANPEIVLLDEPTTSLDMEVRYNLMKGIFRIRDEIGTTVLFTTHHLEDAENFSDKICLLSRGKIILDGSMQQLRERFNNFSVQVHLRAPEAAAEVEAYCTAAFPGADSIARQGEKTVLVRLSNIAAQGEIVEQLAELEERLGCVVEVRQVSLEDFYLMDGDFGNYGSLESLGQVDMEKCWERLLTSPRDKSFWQSYLQILGRSRLA